MGKHMAGFFKTVDLHEHKPLNRPWNFLLVLASFDTISLLEKYEWIWGLQKHLLRPESDVKQNVIWISLETIPRQRAGSLCWNAAVHSLCSAKNENSFYTKWLKILIRDVRFMQKIMLYTRQRINLQCSKLSGKSQTSQCISVCNTIFAFVVQITVSNINVKAQNLSGFCRITWYLNTHLRSEWPDFIVPTTDL